MAAGAGALITTAAMGFAPGSDDTAPGTGTGSKLRRTALALAPLAAGYFASYLFRNVNAVLGPDMARDLGIGVAGMGRMTSVYFVIFAAAQLPVGILLDRYGPRNVQVALLLLTAAGAMLWADSSTLVEALAGRALIGLGTTGCLVAGLKASATWFPRERVPTVNGFFIMCGGLGALAATWPAEVASEALGWRGLVAVLAVVAAAIAVAVAATVPPATAPARRGADQPRFGIVLRDRMFRRFAPLSASCFGTVLAVQGLWVGPWLADVNGLPRASVATDLAAMAAVLVVSAPLWGLATRRLHRRFPLLGIAGGAAGLLLVLEGLIVAGLCPRPAIPWCGFAMFGGMTVLSFTVLAEHFPAATIGRANAVLNVLHIGWSFVVQIGFGEILALWPTEHGHVPQEAYRVALLLPMLVQAAALAWMLPAIRLRSS